ncbi:MAG: hypothetical protein HRT72_02240 [Flavobacteriales bacterium]|nr:hypothetical protein [Flavobacteriales bacterium]
MFLVRLVENNFGALLFIFGVTAFFFPGLFTWGEEFSSIFLMLSLFLGCLKIDFSEIIHIKKNVGRLCLFVLLNLIIHPLVFFAISFALDQYIRVGMFLILATSGAVVTPLLASILNLRILWSAVYVVISSALLPFTLPFLTKNLFNIELEISILEMMLFLAKMVFIPSLLAFIFRQFLPTITIKIKTVSGLVGSIGMSIFLGIVIAVNEPYLGKHMMSMNTLYITALMFVLFFARFLLGYLMPSESKIEKWTNALMFGNMNNGLMILLASQFFGPEVLFVVLLSEIPWVSVQPIFQTFVHKKLHIYAAK